MKKITLFLMLLFTGTFSYGQLAQEGFEGTWPPTGWGVYDNGWGLLKSWTQTPGNGSTVFPSFEGEYAAVIDKDNISDTNPTPQDWLVTPLFTVPDNPELRFFSRLGINGDDGGLYRIMVSTDSDPSNLAAYTQITEWTELEINPTQQVYNEIVVPLAGLTPGTDVYLAFVMEADDADRWIIDNVSVLEQCLAPENLSVTDIDVHSLNLTWDNPSGASSWEIEVLPVNEITTGNGVVHNGALPYFKDGLVEDTQYKYFVRSLCDQGPSTWSGPYIFRTARYGDSCDLPITITSLPFTATDNTANSEDNYTGDSGTNCGNSSFNYLNGQDIVYTYTAASTGLISLNLTNISDDYAAMLVYTSCEDIGVNCYSGVVNDFFAVDDMNIDDMAVTAGTTYYIVISSSFSPSIAYTLTIQEESCPAPEGLTSSAPGLNGITLNWTEVGSALSWDYVYQEAGTGLPMGSGTAIDNTSVTLSGLPESTQYELYVRSDCGDGTYSSWSGPLLFNTLCGVFATPFQEGFNSDSASQFCWTVNNISGAESTWNLDFTGEMSEGNQSAQIEVGTNGEDNNDMLISPAIQLTGNQRLRFRYKTDDYGAVAFKVVLSTTGTAPEDFTTELLPLANYANSQFIQKTVNLSDIPSGPAYIAWQVPPGLNPGYQLIIDEVIVEDLPPCAEPSELTATDITANTATLSWIAGNQESDWEIIVGEPSVIGVPGNSTSGVPATNPYPADGLVPGTLYAFYVRSVCGLDGNSSWTGPVLFTTGCEAFNIPFFEGFNTDSSSQDCWKVVNADGDWAEWYMDVWEPFEGDESASLYTGNLPNDDWILSPAINLTGNQRLKYHYKTGNGAAGFRVMLSTTQRDIEDFTQELLPEATYTNEEYLKKVISLEGYTGTVYIAWHVPSDGVYEGDLFLDNIVIEEIPACPEPLDITIDDITQNSAQVSWTAGGEESQWELIIYADGDDVPDSGIPLTGSPYTVTELANGDPILSGATYHVQLRAVCSDTESSVLSDEATFVTLISNDDCENAINVPVNSGPECEFSVQGTINGATASPQENPCGDWTYADDDVWFEFTATAAMHTVSIIDISDNGSTLPGGNTFLMFIVYEGDDCGNLTQISDCMGAYQEFTVDASTALFKDLTVGQNYKIRIFSPLENTNQTSTFKVCIKTPVTPVAVNNTQYTVEQLVADVLFGGDCVEVSNVTWSTGTNFPEEDNPNGIAYFNQNGSDFGLEEGILLTTGNALMAPGPNYVGMEQGFASWPGDTDIDAIMAQMIAPSQMVQPSVNASLIEFDFVPQVNTLNFDFIFASEEYGVFWQCWNYDTFAILLTDDQGNTQNIALVPGTTDPVSVWTVSGAAYTAYCAAQNLEWFDKYNMLNNYDSSSLGFNGQTKVMTAVANVQPNSQYHLKIVIAETDNNLDSGVFIKGGTTGAVEVDLGPDMLVATNNAVCDGEEAVIQTGLDPDSFTFEWTLNGEVIDNQTAPDLTVSEPGTYGVNTTLTGTSCVKTAEIVVEYYPAVEDVTTAPVDLVVCSDESSTVFDLSQNSAIITQGLNPENYTITYHISQDDAISDENSLETDYTNTSNPQVIYVRVNDLVTGCYGVHSFELQITDPPLFNFGGPYQVCDPAFAFIELTAENFDIATATYNWTLDGEPIAGNGPLLQGTGFGTYEVTVTVNNCSSSLSVAITQDPDAVLLDIQHGCENASYLIHVSDVDGSFDPDTAEISWEGPGGFWSSDADIQIEEEGLYTVTITTPEGCIGTGTVEVNSISCLIPRGISPNGDGMNDEFDLSGFNVTKLSIFNRYGKEVYSKTDYTNEWYGLDEHGKELPTGTYFYSLELNDGTNKTGWVYINRED